MNNKYEIEKITDILAIPEESFDDFLIDLKSYYQFGRSMPQLIDNVAEVSGIQTKTVLQKMTWIDDKKHDATINLVSHSNVQELTRTPGDDMWPERRIVSVKLDCGHSRTWNLSFGRVEFYSSKEDTICQECGKPEKVHRVIKKAMDTEK